MWTCESDPVSLQGFRIKVLRKGQIKARVIELKYNNGLPRVERGN